MASKKKKATKKSRKASEFWGTHRTSRGSEPLKRRKKVGTRIAAPKHDAGSKSLQRAAHRFFKAKAGASDSVAAHMAAANKRGYPKAEDSVAAHMAAASKRGFGAVGYKPRKTRKKGKKKAKKTKTVTRAVGMSAKKPSSGERRTKKKAARKSGGGGRTVTAAELLANARNRVTRSKTGSLKVWTCIGKVRSGCGGGKKGGHVIG